MSQKVWRTRKERRDKKCVHLPKQQGKQVKNEEQEQADHNHLKQAAEIQQGHRVVTMFDQKGIKLFLIHIEVAVAHAAVFGEIDQRGGRHIPHGGHGRVVFINCILE